MSKYEKYKPSGIDWIGEVPEQWKIKRLKDLVNPKITDGPHETPELVDDEDSVPFISAEAITENGINYEARGGNISVEQDRIYSLKCKPKRDDIFIVKSGSTTGRIGYVDTDLNFNIWSPLALVRSNIKNSPRFLFHFLSSDCIQRQIQNSWSFGTQPNIGMGVLERLRLSLPELEEQLSIANYLDQQTQKIDRLIANKKAQAEKLKELRQIEINNAVTKGLPAEAAAKAGLDPNPEMKDSGIEWLGEIPEHWDEKRLKNLVSPKITDGPHETPELVDDLDGVPFISAEAITENGINYGARGGNISVEQDRIYSQKCKPKRDDIFMVKSGSTTGRIGYVDSDQNFNIWSPLALIRSNSNTCSRFLFFALCSNYVQKQVQLTWSFGTQPNIGMGVIERLRVVVAPKSEQIEIAGYLQERTTKIDILIKNIESQIEKLQELRKIKIYEAVTGKINVNEYA